MDYYISLALQGRTANVSSDDVQLKHFNSPSRTDRSHGPSDAYADGEDKRVASNSDDKKFTVLFDTSKKEMLNPNQGYKKIVQKLKTRYKCDINKDELRLQRMAETHLLLLGGPKMPFTAKELQEIRQYVEQGGSCMVMMNEGGESRMNTNINAMLEQMGIFVNTDSVIRKAF